MNLVSVSEYAENKILDKKGQPNLEERCVRVSWRAPPQKNHECLAVCCDGLQLVVSG
jgi:hypothetical protein